ILKEINEETARYCILASLLGTRADGEMLRRKLKLSRGRIWDHTKQAQSKLIPVLKRKASRACHDEELERMYRAFSACLEFLEEQYSVSMYIEHDFILDTDQTILINAGISENSLPKKMYDKLLVDRLPGTDILSVKSFGSGDALSTTTDDVQNLQREIEELRELVYSMNQSIAIQSWEIDPEMETEKFTIHMENGESVGESVGPTEQSSEENESRKIRCVSIVIVVIMIVIVGGIVGILMGVLD
ncbi:hypothetical protein DPMN_114031, partial [Dreissena polymorpha]